MAGPAFKYVNLNPFPIYLPTKGGTSILFRNNPPESTTDPWYSRFTGPRQLTQVPIDSKIEDISGSTPVRIEKLNVETIFEDETNDYIKRSGIYQCKHCGVFRTGTIVLFNAHMNGYHKRGEGRKLSIPNIQDTVPDIQPGTKEESDIEKEKGGTVSEEKDVVGDVASEQIAKLEDAPVESYSCPHCHKAFASDHGLTIHIGRMHATVVPS